MPIKIPGTLFTAIAGLALAGAMGVSAAALAQNKNITVVVEDEPENLDSCNTTRSTMGRIVKVNIIESLVMLDPATASLTPRLATSWQQVSDKVWTFKLRSGVKFSDGEPFTAAAVVQSFERTFNSPTITCETRAKIGGVKFSAKALDPLTLEITTVNSEPILPVRMSLVGIESPKTPKDKLVNNPVGTGPYVLDRFNPGKDLVLKQNPIYWGPKPIVEQASYIVRKESSVRAAMVKVGEADLSPNIAVQDVNDPTTDFSFLNSESTRLRIDSMTPPLNDKRVRLALNYAVDRNAIKGTIMSKDVLHAAQLVVPSIPGHNHEIDKQIRPYDPAKAKQLLAEAKAAGAPVDKEITLFCRMAQFPNAEELMEALLGYFKAVGFNMKLQCVEPAEHSATQNKPFTENRLHVFQDQHDNNNGDPTFTVFTKYTCEGRQSTVCDKAIDDLEKRASTTPLGPERVRLWEQVLKLIYEEAHDVTLYHMVGYSRVGKRLNFKPSIATNSEVPLEQISFK